VKRKRSTAPSSRWPSEASCNETATVARDALLIDAELDTRPLERALAEARATFVAALARADTEAIAALYTADATLLPPAAEAICGREAIKRFWHAGLAAGIVAIRVEPAQLDRDIRLAYELGTYELQLRPGTSRTIVDRGSYVLIQSQQDDRSWRRRVEIFTPTATRA
jgi:uncharacterized protein (TIGR02246 family)